MKNTTPVLNALNNQTMIPCHICIYWTPEHGCDHYGPDPEFKKPQPLFASLDELKAAVKAGNSVHWSSDDFLVINRGNAWLIRRAGPGNPQEIGLTWSDGVTLNNHATLDQFYISNTEIIPYK